MRISSKERPRSIRKVHLANELPDVSGSYEIIHSTASPTTDVQDVANGVIAICRSMIENACACQGIGARVEYYNCEQDMSVPATSEGIIKWQSSGITSGYIDHLAGTFTPKIAGYYHVAVYFYDEYGNPSGRQEIRINGNGTTNTYPRAVRDSVYIDLYASKLVYCNGTTDTITIGIYNGGAATNTYRSITGSLHVSYCHIHYIGK